MYIPEDEGHHEGHGRKDVAHGACEGWAGVLKTDIVEVLVDHWPVIFKSTHEVNYTYVGVYFRKADIIGVLASSKIHIWQTPFLDKRVESPYWSVHLYVFLFPSILKSGTQNDRRTNPRSASTKIWMKDDHVIFGLTFLPFYIKFIVSAPGH